METKAKLSKKVLSLFLSVLMAFSCLTVALPSLAPAARAESVEATEDQWTSLANALTAAFNGGYFSGSDFGNYVKEGNKLTVNDESDNGYFYNIAKALADVAAAEGTVDGHNHNASLRAFVKSELSARGVTLNTRQENFIDLILDAGSETDNGYGQYGPESPWHGSEADAAALPSGSIVIELNRSQKAAVLSDYETLESLGDQVQTKYTLTFTTAPVAVDTDVAGEVGRAYVNTGVTAVGTETDLTLEHINDLKAYALYVNGTDFAVGFNAWYRGGLRNNNAVYAMEDDALVAVVEGLLSNGLLVNANLADDDVRERFIGVGLMAEHDTYVKLCQNVHESYNYVTYVRWLMEGAAVAGALGKTEYSLTDPTSIQAVISQAKTFEDNMAGVTEAALAALNALFGYESDAASNSFDKFIKELEGLIHQFYLQEINTAAKVLLNNGADTTYSFTNVKSDFYPITYGENGSGVQGTLYVKSSDKEIDKTKTYYTQNGTVSYVATDDTELTSGKTYYVLDEETNEYVVVEAPAAEEIDTYFEQVFTPAYAITADKAVVAGKTYFTLADGEYTAVKEPTAEELSSYYEYTFTAVEGPVRSNLSSYFERTEILDVLKGVGRDEYLSEKYQSVSYVPTEDTSVVSGKTYYDENGNVIANPVNADIGTYYERVVDNASTCPINDSDLEKLVTFFTMAVRKIDAAAAAGVNVREYITENDEAAIRAMKEALDTETETRGIVNEAFLSDYEYFLNRVGSYNPASRSVAQLKSEITAAEAKYTTLTGKYPTFANSAKGKTTRNFIDKLYLELYDRAAAQLAKLEEDYNGSIALRNYYVVRADYNNISRDHLKYLTTNSYTAYELSTNANGTPHVNATTVSGIASAMTAALNRINALDGGNRRIADIDESNLTKYFNELYEFTPAKVKDDSKVNASTFYYSSRSLTAVVINPTDAGIGGYYIVVDKTFGFTSNIYTAIQGAKLNRGDITRNTYSGDFARTSANRFTADFKDGATPEGNKASVEDTIHKLDQFLANQQFTTLLGADERGKNITTLTEYIQDILVEEVFSDKLINTIVGLLFPLLTDLFDNQIMDLLEGYQGMSLVDLTKGQVDDGYLWLYLNGNTYLANNPYGTYSPLIGSDQKKYANDYARQSGRETDKLRDIVTNVFKLNIYPNAFSTYLRGKGYTAIASSLTNTNNTWDVFKDAETQKISLDFDWGIDSVTATSGKTLIEARKDKFVSVLGDVFGAAESVLQSLFGNKALKLTVNGNSSGQKLATAIITDLEYNITIGAVHPAIIEAYHVAASININEGLNLYKNLWIPLMEALGMNAGVFTWNQASTYVSRIQGSFSISTLAEGLINPIYELVLALSAKPVETVLKLLPNLAYHIMNNSLNKLLDITIDLNVKLADNTISGCVSGGVDLNADGSRVSGLINLISDFLVSILRDYLDLTFNLDLGDMLDLSSLLGFDIKDLNSLLKGVLKLIDENIDLELPAINTYRLATCFTSISNSYSTNRGNGSRTYVTADIEKVLFVVVDYLINAVKSKGTLASIMGLISTLTGNEINLPDIVFTIVENIGGTGTRAGEQAFVALIELLNAQEYSMKNMRWYNTEGAEGQGTLGLTLAGFVYTKYNTEWTTKKADYLYDNIDNVINSVFDIVSEDILKDFGGDANVWLSELVNSIFTNEGIMNVVEIVTLLGNALAASSGIVKLLKNTIQVDGRNADPVNLYTWYNAFGYIYEDYRIGANADNDEFLAYNTNNAQTYVYRRVAEKDNAGKDVTINPNDSSTYTWQIVRAYPVAPGELVEWRITDQTITHLTGSNRIAPYNNPFTNLEMSDYVDANGKVVSKTTGGTSDGDPLYAWTVTLTADTAALMPLKDDGTAYAAGDKVALVDGSANARAVFTAIFSELIGPLAPVFSLILTGDDLDLFGGNLKIKGYESYNGAILPLMEAVGVYDLMSQAEFESAYGNNIKGGFNYLVTKLFNALSDLLRDDRVRDADGNFVLDADGNVQGKGAFQKLVDMLPHLFYFLQSDGITTVLRNVGMFAWQLIDTIRPILDVNVDDIIHLAITSLFGYVYDTTDEKYQTGAIATALMDLLGLGAPAYSDLAAGKDKEKVDAIFNFTIKDLSLERIYDLVAALTGLDLSPLRYAFEGMCIAVYENGEQVSGVKKLLNGNGVHETTQYTHSAFKDPTRTDTAVYEAYTLMFRGRDVITVTVSVLLDFLRYGDNAKALDELLGTVRERLPGQQRLLSEDASADGLIQALELIFKDIPSSSRVLRPNWDYIFEGRRIPDKATGNTTLWEDMIGSDEDPESYVSFGEAINNLNSADLHELHLTTMNNLRYVTDWKPETADATAEVLENLFTYITGYVDLKSALKLETEAEINSFGTLINALLDEKVFTANVIETVVNLLARIYDIIPKEIRDVIDNLIEIDMNAWDEMGFLVNDYPFVTDKDGNRIVDEDGGFVLDTDKEKSYRADLSYKWFNAEDSGYVKDRESFLAALKEIIKPAANLFSFIFLSRNYRMFNSFGDDIQHYDDDEFAIVINGANAYANGIVPIFEALGEDLTNYKPEKYIHETYDVYGNLETAQYDSELFIEDMFEVFTGLFDKIAADPVNWLLDVLPGVIYFINAKGLNTSIENIFGSIEQVISAVNTLLPASSNIDIADFLGSGVNLTNLDLRGIFDLIYTFTSAKTETGDDLNGLYFNRDLQQYVEQIYIGEITAFESANGYLSFRMNYSSEEDKGDMITVLLSLVLEYLTDQGTFVDSNGNVVAYDNVAALDRLLQGDDYVDGEEGTVGKILTAISNPKSLSRFEIDWDYYTDEYTLGGDGETAGRIYLPGYAFQYLNYTTHWKRNNAQSLAEGLDALLISVLKQLPAGTFGEDEELYNTISTAETLGDIIDLDSIYSAKTLQGILEGVAELIYPTGKDPVLPEGVLKVVGLMLGADIDQWNHKYAFADVLDGEGKTEAVTATDAISYVEDADGFRTYLVNDKASFIAGLVKFLQPASGILSWLLFGDDFDFFSGNTDIDKVLIKIKGSYGYRDGLALLLEALGCEGLQYSDVYAENVDLFISDLAHTIADRAEDIASDPINELAALIPELIYFVNAGGLQASVTGLLSGPLGLLTQIDVLQDVILNALNLTVAEDEDGEEAVTGDRSATEEDYAVINKVVETLLNTTLNESLSDLLEKLGKESYNITFNLDDINLKYLFEVMEEITGLEISDVAGNKLDSFVIGQITSYASKSESIAYRATFRTDNTQDFADFITIVLSLVVDTLKYKNAEKGIDNIATLMDLLSLEADQRALVNTIMDFLEEGFEANTMPIDWFYFDENYALYEETYVDGELVIRRTENNAVEISAASEINVPEPTINYLTYASDWTDETATYLSEHLGEIVDSVLGLIPALGVSSLNELISTYVNLDELYSAETLNGLLEQIAPLADNELLQGIVGDLLKIVLDIDLSGYAKMEAFDEADFTGTTAQKRASFVRGLTDILAPLSPILDWLLFGESLSYFDKKDLETGAIEELIKLDGSYGYEYGLVPILEALGVILPQVKDGDKTENLLYTIINNTLSRVEVILANPIDEVLALLPNLIYFINTNALAACVNNLFDAVFTLVNKLSPVIFNGQAAEEKYNVNHIIDNLFTYVLSDVKIPEEVKNVVDMVNFQKLDLMAIIEIVEELTGLEIAAVLQNDEDETGKKRIENFYLADIVYNENSASKSYASFKMLPSNDTLTVIVNFLLEVITYGNNPKTIDALIGQGNTVENVVRLINGLREIRTNVVDFNWNYFDETVTLNDTITVPANAFLYLDYNNSWTFDKAVYLEEQLDGLVEQVLALIPGLEATDLSELLSGFINLDEYLSAGTLINILDTIEVLLYSEDAAIPEALLRTVGYFINADLTKWNGSYTFEQYSETETYEVDETYGLRYHVFDDKIYYAIEDAQDFATGLRIILEPAEGLLGWLLLGDTFGFFVSAKDGNVDANGNRLNGELIRVPGSDGYNTGLVLLLEALGCKDLQPAAAYDNTAQLVESVINSVLARLQEILANPIEEVLNLIPELIYFINAGGLNAVVTNVAGSIIAILEEVRESGILPEDTASQIPDVMALINSFVVNASNGAIDSFDLAEVNLDWLVTLIEKLTGLEITDVLGHALEYFTIGVVERYNSATRAANLLAEDGVTTLTYKMVFDTVENIVDGKPVTANGRQARADMITIILSLAIDLLGYVWEGEDGSVKSNAAVIENLINANGEMIKPGTILNVLAILKGAALTEVEDIDWFYMDGFKAYDKDGNEISTSEIDKDSTITVTHTINYLTYASDWTQDAANYVIDNYQSILNDVLKLLGQEETTIAKLIADQFTLEDDLYTAENLNSIVGLVSGLADESYEILLNLVGLIIDVDLGAYKDMKFTIADVTDRDSFIDGLVQVLEPVQGLLNWLLFGEDFTFFYDNDFYNNGEDAHDLINLIGNEGFAYGLVPILEALGVQVPALPAEGKLTKDNGYLKAVITAVLTRVEEILAYPVDEVLALLPNLLYFINANGLSVSVRNLLNAVTSLLDTVQPILADLGVLPIEIKDEETEEVKYTISELDVNKLITLFLDNDDVTVEIEHLTLIDIVKIVEALTGLKIQAVVDSLKIENFYLGRLSFSESANGKPSFRMEYSDTEGKAEMLTVVLNFVVDILVNEDNLDAVLALIDSEGDADLEKTKQTVKDIVTLLTGGIPETAYEGLNWNYFDGEKVIKTEDGAETVVSIRVPKSKFIYLAYQNDWTYTRAKDLNDNLADLVNRVLGLVEINGNTYENLTALINDLVDLDGLVFNADNLNTILEAVSGFFYGEDALIGSSIAEFAGLVLGAELTQWKQTYTFEAKDDTKTYTENSENGLKYRTADDGTIVYTVESKTDFVNGLVLILTPAQRLLSWLLLGNAYGFFVSNEDGNVDENGNRQNNELIRIPGSRGYNNGLGLLLEALGVKGLKDTYADGSEMLKSVLTAVVDRVDEILNNPVDEVLALIPEVIYFINANGLKAVINNVAGFAFNIIKTLGLTDEDGNAYDITYVNNLLTGMLQDMLKNDEVTVDLEAIDLDWVIELVETLTGLEIKAVFENTDVFKTFAVGEAVLYDSVADFDAYRMVFSDGVNGADRADMITIALTFVLDLLKNSEHNQAWLEENVDLLPEGSVAKIIDLISGKVSAIDVDVEWFYFTESGTYTYTDGEDLTKFVPAINYLTYASDWSERIADFVDDNLDAFIVELLSIVPALSDLGVSSVKELVENYFKLSDYYNAETLNGVVETVSTTVSDLLKENKDIITEALDLVIDVDLAAWDNVTFGSEVNDRATFVNGLVKVLEPIFPVLDWLLFGDDLAFFNKTTSEGIQDMIVVKGYEGYANGLVPLLEALGVQLPSIKNYAIGDERYNTASQIAGVLNAVLQRVEDILNNPVEEALALIPNVLYFINANGLASAVNHLLGAVLQLVDTVNPVLEVLLEEPIEVEGVAITPIDVDRIVNNLLQKFDIDAEISTKHLNLVDVFKIVEALTGLTLVDIVTEDNLEKFYLGQITYFESATGAPAFKMVYSEDTAKDRADMITVVLNFLLEAVYGEGYRETNVPALEALLNLEEGTIESILSLLDVIGTKTAPGEYDWNYYGGEVSSDRKTISTRTVNNQFTNYLTYLSNWTEDFANDLYKNLPTLVDSVLTLVNRNDPDAAKTLSEIISNNFTLYKAEYINQILDLVQQLYGVLDDKILETIGLVLDVDLTLWKGLSFEENEITNAYAFRKALVTVVEPIYSVLDWILFGRDYAFFVSASDGNVDENGDRQNNELIRIAGGYGYAYGLVPVLEALGVVLPEYTVGEQTCASTVTVDGVEMSFFEAVIKAVLDRVDEILANPVEQVLALLPNVLYFINANGLSTAVKNLLGFAITAVNALVDPENGGIIRLEIDVEGQDEKQRAATIEEYVEKSFGVDLNKLDLEGIFNFLENLKNDDGDLVLHGLKLNEVFTHDFDNDGVAENILEYFYIGSGAELYETSVTEADGTKYVAYRMDLDDDHKGDLLTVLLSVVLEVVLSDVNETALTEIVQGFVPDFTEEKFTLLKALLTSGIGEQEYTERLKLINWVYFYDYSEAELNAKILEVLEAQTNALPALPDRTTNYLQYDNNWNKDLRNYLDNNLESIVDVIVNMITNGESADLAALLKGSLNLYTDDTANTIMGYVVNALSSIDDALISTVGELLGADNLADLKKPITGVTDKASFINAFVRKLTLIKPVLDFVLFGDEYGFFTHLEDGQPATIVVKGGQGFKYGLAPILQALGIETKDITKETAIEEIVSRLVDRIDGILYGGDVINEVLALLPELIYFINADGLSVSVQNLLAPIDALLAQVSDAIGLKNEDGTDRKLTVNSLIAAVDLDNLNFDFIFGLVKDRVGIDVAAPIGEYVKKFYFGELTHYTSYDNYGGFRMGYTADENRIDMITILITLVLDIVSYKEGDTYLNQEAIVKLIMDLASFDETKATQTFNAIMALLTNGEKAVKMEDYKWKFTEYADTGRVLSPVSGVIDSMFGNSIYGPLYTREMGEYITKYFPLLVDTYITLLGVDNGKGGTYKNLNQILSNVLGNTIYKTSTLQSVADAISGALGSLVQTLKDAGLYTHIAEVLKASLGIDLEDLVNIKAPTIQDGNKTQFVNAICNMLAPVAPILRWLLTDEDIAFFNNREGDDYLVLQGAEGYQYAIIPILEALHVDKAQILDQETYAAQSDADLLKVIINPILNRLDAILADPMNEIFVELPAVIYFLNSDGLDTAFKNLLNAVYNILTAIDPLVADVEALHDKDGNVSLYSLIGIEGLKYADLNSLLDGLISNINESAPLDLTGVIGDAANELLLGKLVSFTSVRKDENGNNFTDYTMEYAQGKSGDQADMATLILRLLLKFISVPQNVKAIEALLKDSLSENGYKFLCALLENFGQMASTDGGMDKIMYTFYYIFYAALNAGVATNNGLSQFNGNYSFLNQLFATSNVGFLRQLEISFGDLLNRWTPDVVDDDEVVPNGFIRFFRSIGDFFRRIFAWFQNLFK